MKRSQNILDGKVLSEVLPKIKEMHEQGFNLRDIANKFNLSAATVHHYYNGYKSYLRGVSNTDTDRLKRAIPYLNIANGICIEKTYPKEKIVIVKKRMSDQELADALPIMMKMKSKGMSLRDIGNAYGIGVSTVSMFCNGYEDYLKGKRTDNAERISRAVLYMGLKSKDIAQHKPKEQLFVKQKFTEDAISIKIQREITLFWGFFSIKF